MATIVSNKVIDNTIDTPGRRTTLVTGNQTYGSITHMVSRISEEAQPLAWWVTFLLAVPTLGMFGGLILYLFLTGVGVWGNMSPVFWAWPIVNFVFWVGIGHAGTLISGDFVLVPSELADGDQSSSGSDDNFCGGVCRNFPWHSRWTCLAGILVDSLS